MKFAVSDLDIFYISYDEPNADANFSDLQARSPRPIRRVHGVKGLHAAHRQCAALATTPRFVTIDGDNIVNAAVFFQRLDDEGERDIVFSFKAKNIINGLEYGNGGVKIWPRGLLLGHPTHESAQNVEALYDFCWTYRYMQIDFLASSVHCNASALQAFRSGYREGIKLTLTNGERAETFAQMADENSLAVMSRLNVWCSVGADMPNGWWAMFGARQAIFDNWVQKVPYHVINDFDGFRAAFLHYHVAKDPENQAKTLGRMINDKIGYQIADLDPFQSAWFKDTYVAPTRAGLMLPGKEPLNFED